MASDRGFRRLGIVLAIVVAAILAAAGVVLLVVGVRWWRYVEQECASSACGLQGFDGFLALLVILAGLLALVGAIWYGSSMARTARRPRADPDES